VPLRALEWATGGAASLLYATRTAAASLALPACLPLSDQGGRVGENGKVAQAFVRTSRVCAQYACATELIPDHINTIRTQTRQSKLILINASSDVGQILNICLYNTYAYGIEYIYILPAMLSVPARYRLEDR